MRERKEGDEMTLAVSGVKLCCGEQDECHVNTRTYRISHQGYI